MKNITLIFCLLLMVLNSKAQDYITRNGSISFYSHTPLEDVKATNNEVVSVLNTATGSFEFKVAVKSFHFAKQAMEDHFNNSDYMNSETYPKAGFSGKISDISKVDFSKDGSYDVTVEGNLTIKNTTKPLTAKGTIIIKNGAVSAQSTFNVNRKEFDVIGEAFVQKKLNDQMQVTVNCEYEKR